MMPFPWFRLSHITAGFVAVLVGYSSSVAIVFQAANAAGATAGELNSWLWALGIGMGLSCIGLSLAYRQPILTAWSTPGAALLVTSLADLSMSQAIGAFLFSSLLMTLAGLTGSFQRLMQWVPQPLAAAMLAGVLVGFGLDVFVSLEKDWALAGLMVVSFFLARRILPRYAIPISLACGILWAFADNQLQIDALDWTPAMPIFIMPEFSLAAMLGVGIPLFIVTLSSQNVPGLAVLRANGYHVNASPLISWTGGLGLVLGPFGGYAFNLAAITAAICMTPDADPDPSERWRASVWAGIFYVFTGLFGATVVSMFIAFPQVLIATIAGLALLGTIAGGLHTALAENQLREAALVTFLTTASGMTLLGLGSAFWGLVFGLGLHRLNGVAYNRGI